MNCAGAGDWRISTAGSPCGRRAAGDGRWAAGDGQRAAGDGRWAAGDGRWAAGGAALFGSMHKKYSQRCRLCEYSISILFVVGGLRAHSQEFSCEIPGDHGSRAATASPGLSVARRDREPGPIGRGMRPGARAYRSQLMCHIARTQYCYPRSTPPYISRRHS